MAKKKRRRRPSGARPQQTPAQQPTASQRTPPPRTSPAVAARRDRKGEAKLARQAALRRMRRQRMLRRAAVWGGGGLAIVLVAFFVTNQSGGSGKLSKAGERAAAAAGCTGVESPPDQGREHLDSGAAFTYDQQPPTSGPHDPTPLNAGVYDTPQSETNMVHSLEHGAVEIYYQPSGTSALPSDVIDAMKTAATGRKVIMTPAPETLSPPLDDSTFTVALAFAAWDRLLQCPNTVTADQARTIVQAFITGFVDAGNAPEAGRPI